MKKWALRKARVIQDWKGFCDFFGRTFNARRIEISGNTAKQSLFKVLDELEVVAGNIEIPMQVDDSQQTGLKLKKLKSDRDFDEAVKDAIEGALLDAGVKKGAVNADDIDMADMDWGEDGRV